MRIITWVLIILSCATTFAKNDKKNELAFDVVPLNSPVSEKVAKFQVKVPSTFKIDRASYIVFGPRLFKVQVKNVKDVKLIDTNVGSELHVPVENWKPGSYRLFITLKDKSKKEVQFKKQLKRNIRDYVTFAVAVKPTGVQEPDPIKNNATLLGIDTDSNGVRDDIQLWIASKYKDSPTLLHTFNEYAINIQNALTKKDNRMESNLAQHDVHKTHQCLMALLEEKGVSFQQQRESIAQIRALYANTKLRIQSFEKIEENFHGETGEILDKEEVCSF